jgi:hypothetical protein
LNANLEKNEKILAFASPALNKKNDTCRHLDERIENWKKEQIRTAEGGR